MLSALDAVRAGTKVLVPTARRREPLGESTLEGACLDQLRAAGCEVELVDAFAQRLADPESVAAEQRLLREGAVDAVCLCSALHAQGLAHLLGAEEGADSAGALGGGDGGATFVAAVADDTEATALELGWSPGLVVTAGSPESQAVALVEGLESHFGAGRLLF